jgi:alkanesulfonate monooxygenase SsuD/methylene tetrahydromethanopterin reductase-like flavin-dependent oxidoreductase (luciferase family)
LRFGVGHFTLQRAPGESRTFQELYRDLLSLVKEADEAGLDSIWLTEHHFAPDGYLAAPIPVAAAVLAATARLTVAPGLLAPLHHPLRLAADLAVLDVLFAGRLVVGFGTGFRREEYSGLHIPFEEATSRLEETLDILDVARNGEPFDHHGPAFHFNGAQVVPAPATPGGLRLVMTGGSEAAALRAAHRRAMFMCDPAAHWNELTRLVGLYDAASSAPDLDLPLFCYGFIADSDPWGIMREGFLYLRRTYDGWMGRTEPSSEDPASYRLMVGSRADVVEQVLALRDRFGDRTHVVLRLDYPGMNRPTVAAAIRAYAEVAETVRHTKT